MMEVVGDRRILIVDDDVTVLRALERALAGAGFDTVAATDGTEALAAFARRPADVVVLDWHLPDLSGLDVLATLRQRDPDVYVIMFTAAGSEAERAEGFAAGADDYIVKPAPLQELIDRIAAVRPDRTRGEQRFLEIGGLRIDKGSRRVSSGAQRIELADREIDLLHHLAANAGRTFSREHLLEVVWGEAAAWQSPVAVTEHVDRLREALGSGIGDGSLIAGDAESGYRFVAPTTADDRDVGASALRAIAHELDNALTVITGYTDLAITQLQALASEHESLAAVLDDLALVARASTRAAELSRRLPGAGAADAAAGSAAAASTGSGGETVLLVEDDDDLRRATERILTRHGYRVVVAPDAATAVALHEDQPGGVDIVLTDVVLPGSATVDVAEQIRSADPSIRVLFMSGYSSEVLEAGGRIPAGAALLEKPFTADSLLAEVRAVLDRAG